MSDKRALQLVVNRGVSDGYFLYDFSEEGAGRVIADVILHPTEESRWKLNEMLKSASSHGEANWLMALIKYEEKWPLIFLREGLKNNYPRGFFEKSHVIVDPSFKEEIKTRLIVDVVQNDEGQEKFDEETAIGNARGLFESGVAPASMALADLLTKSEDPEIQRELELSDRGRRR